MNDSAVSEPNDVVPPGADRTIDQQPWPSATTAPPATVSLPRVPRDVPAEVETPPDWRHLDAADGLVPPGYQTARGRPVHPTSRTDRWGIWSCVVGVVGLVQIGLVRVPVISVIAILFGLSGARFGRLDPKPSRSSRRLPLTPSLAGIVLGAAGVVVGLVVLLASGSWSSITI